MNHLGVYAAADLARRGMDDASIARAVRTGDLHRLRRGWYADRAADPVVRDAVATGGVLSCVSALRWHGIWVPHDRRVHARFPLRDRCHRGSCRGYGPLPPLGGPVDSLPVAFGCAARCLDGEGFVVVADSILNTTNYELADLAAAVEHAPQRIRRLLDRCDGRAQSGTETIARLRFRAAGIKVRIQVSIDGVGVVDLLLGERLIVECDSVEFHTPLAGYQKDRLRDRKSLVGNYLTIRLTYDDIMYRWDEVLADVLDLIRRREHRKSPRMRRET